MLEVFHFDKPGKNSSDSHPWNKYSILTTFDVSILSKSGKI